MVVLPSDVTRLDEEDLVRAISGVESREGDRSDPGKPSSGSLVGDRRIWKAAIRRYDDRSYHRRDKDLNCC